MCKNFEVKERRGFIFRRIWYIVVDQFPRFVSSIQNHES